MASAGWSVSLAPRHPRFVYWVAEHLRHGRRLSWASTLLGAIDRASDGPADSGAARVLAVLRHPAVRIKRTHAVAVGRESCANCFQPRLLARHSGQWNSSLVCPFVRVLLLTAECARQFLMSESYSPSFVAKAGFLKAPMIGWFADTLFNCVSVDNSAEVAAAAAAVGKAAPSYDAVADGKSRGATAAIRARLEQLSAASRAPGAGEPPLAVFAEGTTSNGQYLINFRTGALHISLDSCCAFDLSMLACAGRCFSCCSGSHGESRRPDLGPGALDGAALPAPAFLARMGVYLCHDAHSAIADTNPVYAARRLPRPSGAARCAFSDRSLGWGRHCGGQRGGAGGCNAAVHEYACSHAYVRRGGGAEGGVSRVARAANDDADCARTSDLHTSTDCAAAIMKLN